MALLGIFEILLSIVSYLIIFHLRTRKHGLPRNWPFVGMVPDLLFHLNRVHEWCSEVANRVEGTLHFKGPWFLNADMLITGNPSNIHHIMVSNFHNYHKGPEFKEIFDILGDGVFNSDSNLWKTQRRIALSLVNNREFLDVFIRNTRVKVEAGLIPALDHACVHGHVVDLQDLFQRFVFDTAHMLVTGRDPGSLSEDFPELAFSKAMDTAWEAIFYRHFVPYKVWKLQKWLDIGVEKRMRKASKTLEGIVEEIIREKRREFGEGVEGFDMLTSYMRGEDDPTASRLNDDKSLRDAALNFMLAGRDAAGSSLTWFFWAMINNPQVESKIREELKSTLSATESEIWPILNVDELKKLVYLHGAIHESLRLYAPVPFEHKSSVRADTLPTGHRVYPNTKIVFIPYAMARMRSIWGEDCLEFKPERWISDRGGIKHEPAHKFFIFNAGPRSCIGKEVALIQLKAVIAALIHNNYRFQVVDGQNVAPNLSIILQMKHGLKVKVTKRSPEEVSSVS